MTESDTVRRLHVPLLEQDQDGSWFSFCHACSHEVGHHVPRCIQLADDQPWPPYNLTEDIRPPLITPDYVADLNALHNPDSTPDDLRDDITRIIERHILKRPRSLQKAIGPSEIGHECGRYIAYKLAQVDTVNSKAQQAAWRPQIGVWAHNGLADVFEEANRGFLEAERFLVERLVKVASLPALDDFDEDVSGTGDLYDAVTASVVDWKIVGPTTLKNVRARVRVCHEIECAELMECPHKGLPRGASLQYRKQGQTYGKGYAALGLNVKWIVIAFLPAAGELFGDKPDAYFHVERFSPALADEGIDRMIGTKSLLNALPLDTVLGMMPTADVYCNTCPYFNREAEVVEPREPRSLAEGCPGHAGRKQRTDPLLSLIPPPEIDDGSVWTAPTARYDVTQLNKIPIEDLVN